MFFHFTVHSVWGFSFFCKGHNFSWNKQHIFGIKMKKKCLLCAPFSLIHLISKDNEKYFGNWSDRTDWFGAHDGTT
ncbi:hypothetical protein DWY73_09295 [Bacteroides fragilis]|uniref:Uncharacterized protein n=1 Tax=Bacteroides fragilis TaxID=817 RepID=A0A3E5IB41_BACFG|nr:hypothetical protein F3B28_12795 [Bacteroides fragilis]KAA4701132.1 hypothetical protein F3B26_13910 [Bacteroides fragilis]KAA4707344.1 hypothetical protein F3B27_14840 [Bacteroides fragilis]KAA4714009.1 hypothetical protein F3B32_19140 [Bacteroides fragilis]KAA4724992.1 hypothetical protein F3B30_17450 [Bacteroides fragilis]